MLKKMKQPENTEQPTPGLPHLLESEDDGMSDVDGGMDTFFQSRKPVTPATETTKPKQRDPKGTAENGKDERENTRPKAKAKAESKRKPTKPSGNAREGNEWARQDEDQVKKYTAEMDEITGKWSSVMFQDTDAEFNTFWSEASKSLKFISASIKTKMKSCKRRKVDNPTAAFDEVDQQCTMLTSFAKEMALQSPSVSVLHTAFDIEKSGVELSATVWMKKAKATL